MDQQLWIGRKYLLNPVVKHVDVLLVSGFDANFF